MSTNSKSEVARCVSPLTKTINRFSYRIRHKYLHPGQSSTSLTGDHPAGIRKLLLSVGYSYHEKHIIEKSIEEQTA